MPSIRNSENERGQTLLLACVSMIVLLSMAALAVDVSMFYVARTEAQRAADAAALAGATVFSTSGCTSSPGTASACSSATVRQQVRDQAKAVGGQNKVFGQLASIADADVTFPASAATDPLVEVQVHRTMNAFFGNPLRALLGGGSWGPLSVAARATAEAFNPSGSNTPFTTSCLKPWIMPNCDPDPLHKSPANANCPKNGTFINADGTITHPGVYPTGIIGETWTVHSQVLPSQYDEINFTGKSNSGNNYENDILTCEKTAYTCGDSIYTITGKKLGKTDHGVDGLINASSDGPNQGQDTIDTSTGPPFPIHAGSNNPLVTSGLISAGSLIADSQSVATVPMYGGQPLCSGNQCNEQTVVGFMQVFIKYVDHSGSDDQVTATILNVAGCNGAGGGGSGGPPVTGGGNTLVPIRLVRNPGT